MALIKDVKTPSPLFSFLFFCCHSSVFCFLHLSIILLSTSTSPLFPVRRCLMRTHPGISLRGPSENPSDPVRSLVDVLWGWNLNVSEGNNADGREETFSNDAHLRTRWCWCFRAAWVALSATHLHCASERRQAGLLIYAALHLSWLHWDSGEAPPGDGGPEAAVSGGVWRGTLYEKGWEDATNLFGVNIYDCTALIEPTMNVLHQRLCVLWLDAE